MLMTSKRVKWKVTNPPDYCSSFLLVLVVPESSSLMSELVSSDWSVSAMSQMPKQVPVPQVRAPNAVSAYSGLPNRCQ